MSMTAEQRVEFALDAFGNAARYGGAPLRELVNRYGKQFCSAITEAEDDARDDERRRFEQQIRKDVGHCGRDGEGAVFAGSLLTWLKGRKPPAESEDGHKCVKCKGPCECGARDTVECEGCCQGSERACRECDECRGEDAEEHAAESKEDG